MNVTKVSFECDKSIRWTWQRYQQQPALNQKKASFFHHSIGCQRLLASSHRKIHETTKENTQKDLIYDCSKDRWKNQDGNLSWHVKSHDKMETQFWQMHDSVTSRLFPNGLKMITLRSLMCVSKDSTNGLYVSWTHNLESSVSHFFFFNVNVSVYLSVP